MWLAIADHSPGILVHKSSTAVACLIRSGIRFNRIHFGDSLLAVLYELIGLHGTPHCVHFLIIAIDEKESRVSRHTVLGAERSAFLLLHIQFD